MWSCWCLHDGAASLRFDESLQYTYFLLKSVNGFTTPVSQTTLPIHNDTKPDDGLGIDVCRLSVAGVEPTCMPHALLVDACRARQGTHDTVRLRHGQWYANTDRACIVSADFVSEHTRAVECLPGGIRSDGSDDGQHVVDWCDHRIARTCRILCSAPHGSPTQITPFGHRHVYFCSPPLWW